MQILDIKETEQGRFKIDVKVSDYTDLSVYFSLEQLIALEARIKKIRLMASIKEEESKE